MEDEYLDAELASLKDYWAAEDLSTGAALERLPPIRRRIPYCRKALGAHERHDSAVSLPSYEHLCPAAVYAGHAAEED